MSNKSLLICHMRYCVALIMMSLLSYMTQNKPTMSLFCCNSTAAASRHQFSPRVTPTSGVSVRVSLTDPQSSEGAGQVRAHHEMSKPVHNSLHVFSVVAHQLYPLSEVSQQEIKVKTSERRQRMVLASSPSIVQKGNMERESVDNMRMSFLDAGLLIMSQYISDLWCRVFKSGFVKLPQTALTGLLSSLSYLSYCNFLFIFFYTASVTIIGNSEHKPFYSTAYVSVNLTWHAMKSSFILL